MKKRTNKHGLIDLNASKYLFKYQPISKYSLLNLKNERLWASHPGTFNDPFEFKFTQIGHNLMESEIDQIIKEINQLKVVCLSQDPANILMWSHYANFHKGMCLGFYNKTVTYAIKYSDEYPEIDFRLQNPTKRGLQMFNAINSKSKMWEYEKERRMVFTSGTKSEVRYPGELFLIIFGVKTPRADIKRVKSIVKDPDVLFWQCEFVPGQYRLGFTSIQ